MEAILGFSEAKKALGKFRPTSTMWAVEYLGALHTLLKMGGLLHALDPERFRQALDGVSLLDLDPDGALMQRLYRGIYQLAPFDMDQMYQNEGELLYPDVLGYPMGWDEWDEISGNLANNQDAQLFILFTALRFGDTGVINEGIPAFGWDMEALGPGALSGELDWDKMEKALEEAGLGCFNAAWDVACYATGNVYYDFNPYDEGVIPDLRPFDEAGVRWLASEWQAAQPIRARFEEARERLRADPGLADRLVAIYLDCLTPGTGSSFLGGGMTLAEVFSGDYEVGETGEVYADPFYGPLTAGFEDDGEEMDE